MRDTGPVMTAMSGVTAGVILAGCAVGAPGEQAGLLNLTAPGELRLSAADAGHRIRLERGRFLSVALPGDPRAGYRWSVGSHDQAVLREESSGYVPARAPAPGDAGDYTFRFRAAARGTCTLRLVYHRTWEDTPRRGVRSWSIQIQVG